jgi:polyhydroxybutyrate depolymerase
MRMMVLALLVIVSAAVIACSPLRVSKAAAASAMGTKTLGRGHALTTPVPSAGCGKTPPFAAGTSEMRWLASGGHMRTYLLHIPHGYLAAHEYPLVLNFHGHTSTAIKQARYTGFSLLADAAGFIVAYPQGLVGPDGRTGWASGGSNDPHVNDVLFVSDLITRIQAELCVNPQRIFATGFSNGGGMTSWLACELSDRIAAVASVSGSYFTPPGGCNPTRTMPLLEFHGTGDPIVPYNGRPAQNELGVMQWLGGWAQRDGCAPTPITTPMKDGIAMETWTRCQDGANLVHYTLSDGVHVWPTALPPGSSTLNNAHRHVDLPVSDTSLDATSIIWHFFEDHTLPTSPATSTPV